MRPHRLLAINGKPCDGLPSNIEKLSRSKGPSISLRAGPADSDLRYDQSSEILVAVMRGCLARVRW
jgi:hypothetical protein